MSVRAVWWRKLDEGADKVRCELCPQNCAIKPGKAGICKNRGNEGGELVPLMYGRAAAVNLDPVEKKPLYHFCPGTMILSVGFVGCNFHCPFCQNYTLVEALAPTEDVDIDDLVALAGRSKSVGISFTYNEPLVNFEWVRDCSIAFHEAGMKTTAVTNGYLNPRPFEEIAEHIDAFNIDLKYSSDENYKKYSGAGDAQVIRDNIKLAHLKSHVEVTHLVVTGINDNEESFTALVRHIASIDPAIPLHISRYHPMYKYREPSTALDFLRKAYRIAKEELQHVYLGNVMAEDGANSYCPHCGAELVRRKGYSTRVTGLDGSRCSRCRNEVNFVNPCGAGRQTP